MVPENSPDNVAPVGNPELRPARVPSSGWIDISIPLRSEMVQWPGDPPVRIERMLDMERGDSSNLSTISMCAHTGTHMDAPLHYIPDGENIAGIPLETVIGRARVIEIQDTESIKPAELVERRIRRGERILFKTHNSRRRWSGEDFIEDFVFMSKEAARFLADRGVRVVGIDYLSVGDLGDDGDQTHKVLLEAGVWIIEGLDLSGVQPGRYDLICLPLKLDGCDGAPARVLVRPVRESRRKSHG